MDKSIPSKSNGQYFKRSPKGLHAQGDYSYPLNQSMVETWRSRRHVGCDADVPHRYDVIVLFPHLNRTYGDL